MQKIIDIEIHGTLSSNELTNTYLAKRSGLDDFSVLKAPSPDAILSQKEVRHRLSESFKQQRNLKGQDILLAIARHTKGRALAIEYPYLNPSKWKQLTPEIFAGEFRMLLVKATMILDYIHLRGLVHCDVDIKNFFVTTREDELLLKLGDMDLLCKTGSTVDSRIFGTPGLIAPEVFENGRVSPETDNYSFGKSLERIVSALETSESNEGRVDTSLVSKVKLFIKRITNEDFSKRPSILIDSLLDLEILSESEHDHLNRKLFLRILLTDYRISRYSLESESSIKNIFSTENRVYGISEEIVNDLLHEYKKSKLSALSIFKAIFDKSRVKRFGQFWHLDLDHSALSAAYEGKLSVIDIYDDKKSPEEKILSGLQSARERSRSGEIIKSYIILRRLYDQKIQNKIRASSSLYASLLRELGKHCEDLGKWDESIDLYTQTLPYLINNPQETCILLFRLAEIHITTGSAIRAEEAVSQGLALARSEGQAEFELEFRRLEAWLISVSGDHSTALQILSKLTNQCRAEKLWELQAKSLYSKGVIHWKQGSFDTAINAFELALKSSHLNKYLSLYAKIVSSNALVHYEIANYGKALKYCKLAQEYLIESRSVNIIRHTIQTMANCYLRLGNTLKARHCMNNFMNHALTTHDVDAYSLYYLSMGAIDLSEGTLESAISHFHTVLNIPRTYSHAKIEVKAHQNLALAHLYRGDSDLCKKYSESAISIYRKSNDLSSLSETRLILALNSHHNDNDSDLGKLCDIFSDLISNRSNYFAVICLCHLLLSSRGEIRLFAFKESSKLRNILSSSSVPLFDSVVLLLKGVSNEQENPELNIECHKSAFKILDDSSSSFLSSVVCSRLAELYDKRNNPKIAASFYEHASRIVERIGNKVVSERFKTKSKKIAPGSDFHSSLSATLKSLSQVFMSVESTQVTLDKLLGFAIELTGAERGALFLKTPESGELRVVSQSGLQKREIDDAMNLSMSIPRSVTGIPEPMLLEDARSDDRTKSFRSVARYNILSVICFPITLRDETEGALYLDHHTLPAFFRKSDHETVSAIATFISYALSTTLEYRSIKSSYTQALKDKKTAGIYSKFISHDSKIAKLFERMELISKSNTNVLILGESGTGKELLADATHEASLRSDKHIVKLNCAAIPSTLIESQLFGVARNTVTGVSEVEGIFSAADGGTLFMDEVADLPLEVQSKVLRAIEYQQFHKIGSSRLTSVDIRFIFATSKSLPRMISEGSFREDLYHRICTIELNIPPLRERPSDLEVLIDHFVKLFTPHSEKPPVFSDECLKIFGYYDWPGNVRELKNVVESMCIFCRGGVVSPLDLPKQFVDVEPGSKSSLITFERPERETISKLLSLHHGNQAAVARALRMSKTTLHRKIKKYGIG